MDCCDQIGGVNSKKNFSLKIPGSNDLSIFLGCPGARQTEPAHQTQEFKVSLAVLFQADVLKLRLVIYILQRNKHAHQIIHIYLSSI